MNLPPDFDQLVGGDLDGAERARLRRVHSLLVQAGPPPEVSPHLETGPTLGMTLARRPGRVRRRATLLAAALVVIVLAFLAGYIAAGSGGDASVKVMKLTGTPAAPAALASLQIKPRDDAGNWPMHFSVTGLPPLKAGSYYEVYLMKNGKPWASCGTFRVAAGRPTSVDLNAPYRLQYAYTWVVTRQTPASKGPGPIVMTQT